MKITKQSIKSFESLSPISKTLYTSLIFNDCKCMLFLSEIIYMLCFRNVFLDVQQFRRHDTIYRTGLHSAHSIGQIKYFLQKMKYFFIGLASYVRSFNNGFVKIMDLYMLFQFHTYYMKIHTFKLQIFMFLINSKCFSVHNSSYVLYES